MLRNLSSFPRTAINLLTSVKQRIQVITIQQEKLKSCMFQIDTSILCYNLIEATSSILQTLRTHLNTNGYIELKSTRYRGASLKLDLSICEMNLDSQILGSVNVVRKPRADKPSVMSMSSAANSNGAAVRDKTGAMPPNPHESSSSTSFENRIAHDEKTQCSECEKMYV